LAAPAPGPPDAGPGPARAGPLGALVPEAGTARSGPGGIPRRGGHCRRGPLPDPAGRGPRWCPARGRTPPLPRARHGARLPVPQQPRLLLHTPPTRADRGPRPCWIEGRGRCERRIEGAGSAPVVDPTGADPRHRAGITGRTKHVNGLAANHALPAIHSPGSPRRQPATTHATRPPLERVPQHGRSARAARRRF
jgi:hypothetical protein